jgi:bifunctional non-homologous end joining protein LigD
MTDVRNVNWRAPAPRWRRNPPVGFIRPTEPTLVARPPSGPGWLHEVKHDGFRILALKQGERVRVWSRHGADFTYRFPAIAEAVRGLSADEALIDGEAVVVATARRLTGCLM